MLEFVVDRRPNSRLSCQIEVTAAVDGLVVTTPVSQH
jgi:2Fe-2S ferredoxin